MKQRKSHNKDVAMDGPARATGGGYDLVLGLGATGYACARHLASTGRQVKINDSRAMPPQARRLRRETPEVEMRLGGFDETLLADAARVVVSPGIPMSEPMLRAARRAGIPTVSDIDLFFEQRRAPVAGVTGSNGKSTVTCWLDSVLSAAGRDCLSGGNLGTPSLDLLEAPTPDLFVLELSSFQLERSAALPLRAAAFLNLTEDHLDHHGSLEDYAAAKARIFDRAQTAVVHRDLAHVVPPSHPHVVTIGSDAPAPGHYGLVAVDNDVWLAHGSKHLMPASELKLRLRHDSVNALAVLALADALGVAWPEARRGLVAFEGLAHRVAYVRKHEGVQWINDSKGTNVGATVSAIRSVSAPLVLIAGGDAKGADLTPLAAALQGRARAVVALGRDADRLAAAVDPVCDVHRVDSIASAVLRAQALSRPGDSVLLSPACSSLDMFDSFEARGDQFVEAVEALT